MWRYFISYCQTNKITKMSNLQEKKEDYILSLDNSGQLTKMDIIEQNLNAIDFGYELCKREYEEKLRWIQVEEKLPELNKLILLKINDSLEDICFGFMRKSYQFIQDVEFTDNDIVTHWRYFL